MENAGCAAANFILQTLHDVSDLNCIVFCGKGNNGGDGFVVARKLAEQGAAVTIVLTEGEPKTDDAARMLHLARSMELPVFSFEEQPEAVNEALEQVDVIVDAIYGSGFHGEMDVRRRQITEKINSAIAAVFSLDVPSGINCDTGEAAQDAVNADFTIAFDSYKTAQDVYKRQVLLCSPAPSTSRSFQKFLFLLRWSGVPQILKSAFLLSPFVPSSFSRLTGWLYSQNLASSASTRQAEKTKSVPFVR